MTAAWGLVLRSLLRGLRWQLWVTALVPVVAMLIGLTVAASGGTVAHSVWEYAGPPVRWVLLISGLAITPFVMPPYLAHGITRRTFTIAAGLAAGLLAAAAAVYLAVGFLVERAILEAVAGRPQTFAGEHLFTGTGQPHLVIAEYALTGAGYLLGGWLIGTGYYRFGGLGGTLLIPLGIVLVLGVELVLGTGQLTATGPRGLGLDGPDLPLAAALGLALTGLGLGLVAVRALTRTIPLRPRRQP